MSVTLYVELLRDADLALLASAAGDAAPPQVLAARLRAEPERIEALLGRPTVFDALFRSGERDSLVAMSPFLAFAILVARVNGDLVAAPFVAEWFAPGKRVPVFDVGALRDFLAAGPRRLFLAELLASFTRVASGSVRIRTDRGWRRRRYSDLDPIRLAELLEIVPERERPAVHRRLGDTALFLAGVFPDHAARGLLAPRHLERLQRLLGGRAPVTGLDLAGLEWVGRRAYRLATAAYFAPEITPSGRGPSARGAGLLGELAERFGEARRVLNLITDRYLFPVRERWFGLSPA